MAADPLSATFAALADPTRRALVERLAEGEATVGELAEPFDISLPAISRHLRVLERAHSITREADAQRRWCRLRPEGLQEAAVWLAEHTTFWHEQLGSLDQYVKKLQAQKRG